MSSVLTSGSHPICSFYQPFEHPFKDKLVKITREDPVLFSCTHAYIVEKRQERRLMSFEFNISYFHYGRVNYTVTVSRHPD
jgi:hypothetical protein